MKLFFIIVLAVLLLKVPAVGILGTIIFLLYHVFKKSPDVEANKTSSIQPRGWSNLTAGDLADLVLLRLELQNLFESGCIDSEQQARLTKHIDSLCTQHLADFAAVSGNALWQKHRDNAWDLLNHHAETLLGQPPWQSNPIVETGHHNVSTTAETETPITASPLTVDLNSTAVLTEPVQTLQSEIDADLLPVQTLPCNVSTAAVFAIDEEDHSSTLLHPVASVSDSDTQQSSKPTPTLNQYAWKPHEPSRLERTLSAISGWHSMAVPFLMQNIGWFIGVFCFIAGSLFLVHSTTGYASNLIAFFAFFIFTLALLFGGYQLRQKRPELETSSYVIFILSILLIPLTTITATQLLISCDTLGLRIFSGLLVSVELSVFYFVVTLVAGLMDRSLQQGLPKFFIALTAACVLQLLLLILPFWQLLAVIHLLILTILSIGIYQYATQWLQSIFIDQRKIAYFAAGTLVYAALVSFVFITTGNKIVLPAGYYGFFLMVLSGLLFFVDAQFKQWTQQYTYLSRFSFFVYGLSVLALCLVAQYQTASILTLILAIGLYAFIVWRYLTLTPLTIFLACCFWLYSLVVLQQLPESLHFLASLPVLLALHHAAKWALSKRQSAYLALIVYRVLYGLLALLTVWSLIHSEAGLWAMLTAITAGVLTYYALKSAPLAIFTPYSKIADTVSLDSTQNLLNSPWFYTIPALGAVTVFYAPQLPVLTSEAQFSFGLLLLAGCWTYLGLSVFLKAQNTTTPTEAIAQRLNSALLSLSVGLLPLLVMPNPTRIIVLFIAGSMLLWLSYKLLARWLFYGVFIVWGAAFALLKLTYFPPPSNGMVTVLLGIAIWWWLWYVERQENSDLTVLQRDLATQKTALLPAFRLLRLYRVPSSLMLFKDMIHTPLEQLMVLSWLLTMKAVIVRWLADLPSYGWLAAIFLAGLFGGLLIVRYCLIRLLPVPIVLVLTALLMLLKFIGLSTESLLLVTVLFALAVWQWVIYSLAQPLFIKLANALNPFLQDENARITQVTHLTSFFIVLGGVVFQLLNAGGVHNLTLLLTLLTTVGFLWLSDRTYPQLIVRYLALVFSVLTAVELVALTLHPLFQWQTIGTDVYTGLLLTLLSLPLAGLSITDITVQRLYSKPASIIAMMLAFIGVYLQILQATNSVVMVIAPLDYSVLFLAGFSVLIANAKLKWTLCNISAFIILTAAVLWLESSVFHANQPFSLWLGTQTHSDSWLVLGLLSLAITLLSHKLESTEKWVDVYCFPLDTVANLCYGWTLLGTLTLFFATAGHENALPWLLLILLLTLFPLSKNWSGAAQLRGLASACLPTLAVFSLLPNVLDGFSLQTTTVLSGYALWLCASFVIPRFNQRYAEWTIEPHFFPWLGLLLVALSGCWWQYLNEINVGIYCLELFSYCLLMLRYSGWAGFSWLAALAFTAAGIAFNFDHENLPINLLLWGNLQLLLVNFWNRKGEALAQRWQWQQPPLALAFEFTSKFIFVSYLLITSLVLWLAIIDDSTHDVTLSDGLPIGILLNLSFLHLLWLRFSTTSLHGFIYALLLSLWTIYFTCLNTLFQPPLFLTLWSMALLGSIYTVSWFRCSHQSEITATITYWVKFSVVFATLGLVFYSANALAERLLSLAIITCLSATLGWRSTRSTWLAVASIELLLLLHGWPFLLVGYEIPALLPWYALQTTLFMCLSTWLLIRLSANANNAEHSELYANGLRNTSWLTALGLLELGGHIILLKYWIMTDTPLPWLLPPLDAIAALSTGLIISFIGVRHVRHLPDSSWLYGIVTLVAALGFYSRLLFLGDAPVSLWDTALLIAFAYGLFFSQRLFPSKPLLNMALFMPVLAIFTVPLQLASPETSVTLIMTGLLYVMMRRYTQQKIPLYLALLAFNAGVYLWIPSLVDSSHLIQIYVIPAALSILLLLQLHSRELKPSVLMGSRLAATGTIYACATVDVFLRAELSIFILAMVLSVVGILLGIALRTRAFLYTGVSFLLLNVLGQLLRFYPEQGLGKAIVLMVMGLGILGIMIWFNIKRVAILQRINAIQTEMQSWE